MAPHETCAHTACRLCRRREGEGDDEEELELEAAVKARFQGGEAFHAGTIAAINEDGTYDVLYEDHVLEQGVPRDMIQLVQIDPSTQAAIEQVPPRPALSPDTSSRFAKPPSPATGTYHQTPSCTSNRTTCVRAGPQRRAGGGVDH